jgi:hypothetical protein
VIEGVGVMVLVIVAIGEAVLVDAGVRVGEAVTLAGKVGKGRLMFASSSVGGAVFSDGTAEQELRSKASMKKMDIIFMF